MSSSQAKGLKRSLPHSLAEENRKAPPNVKVKKLTVRTWLSTIIYNKNIQFLERGDYGERDVTPTK